MMQRSPTNATMYHFLKIANLSLNERDSQVSILFVYYLSRIISSSSESKSLRLDNDPNEVAAKLRLELTVLLLRLFFWPELLELSEDLSEIASEKINLGASTSV